MVKLDLTEFAEATRRMVQISGVKKTRLMLRVRPMSSRKTFILKSSDGRTTLTTQIAHQGELRIVEGIVNDYVGKCTAALVSPGAALSSGQQRGTSPSGRAKQSPVPPAAAANKGEQQQQQQKTSGKSGGGNQQQHQQQGGAGSGGKKKKGGRR